MDTLGKKTVIEALAHYSRAIRGRETTHYQLFRLRRFRAKNEWLAVVEAYPFSHELVLVLTMDLTGKAIAQQIVSREELETRMKDQQWRPGNPWHNPFIAKDWEEAEQKRRFASIDEEDLQEADRIVSLIGSHGVGKDYIISRLTQAGKDQLGVNIPYMSSRDRAGESNLVYAEQQRKRKPEIVHLGGDEDSRYIAPLAAMRAKGSICHYATARYEVYCYSRQIFQERMQQRRRLGLPFAFTKDGLEPALLFKSRFRNGRQPNLVMLLPDDRRWLEHWYSSGGCKDSQAARPDRLERDCRVTNQHLWLTDFIVYLVDEYDDSQPANIDPRNWFERGVRQVLTLI